MAQFLDYTNERQCYIRYSEDHIGYIVRLNTKKCAKGLIERWHNKEIEGGHILKCQLELNIVPSGSKTWSNFSSTVNRKSDYTTDRSRGSSTSIDDGYFDNKSAEQRDCDSNRKESTASSIDSKRESTLSIRYRIAYLVQLPGDLKDEWEVEGNGGQVFIIHGKTDRKRLAVIKIYKDIISYNKELKIL